ncbi:Anti-sigma-K factor rskA [Klenkia marina]|uniref:Anti-sigma-K factor rskA n=1 Tax=Klenkia marina TaxID=1960309 RepID=A0A1G4XJE5_9ACTN|nr:anti-sigma factor [Klenkia marina]SCX41244.1 Anti-sigma-K factor rskA [Klenkia marina]
MPHCSPEDLALAALGEPLSPADADHIAACSSCTAEVASLGRAVDALDTSGLPADDGPDIPVPDRVWAAIAAQTGVSSAPRAAAGPALVGLPSPADGPAPSQASAPTLRSLPTPAEDDAVDDAVQAVDGTPAGTPAPARRSTTRRWLVVGAVAAGLLVGVAVGAAVTSGGPSSPGPTGPDPGTAVAAAQLDPFGDWDSRGEATLRDLDGQLDLTVQLTAPPADTGDGFYEVWLLSADSGALSLGTLQGASGSFVVPDGVDLADYDTVDVSLEPFDGDPEHSTDSIARGTLG